MASPCSSLDAAFFAVVGCRVSDVDFPLACLAEGIVASGASEEEVVAMGIEGLVDPAGRDLGVSHPLPLAPRADVTMSASTRVLSGVPFLITASRFANLRQMALCLASVARKLACW